MKVRRRLCYTGVGSRKTPPSVLRAMTDIADVLACRNWILRSGGADGADAAFENGCVAAGGRREIFVPWQGFGTSCRGVTWKAMEQDPYCITCGQDWGDHYHIPLDTLPSHIQIKAYKIAKRTHPNWRACSRGAQALHTRNVLQVLGSDLESPSNLLICWTPLAKAVGGTATAIRLAIQHKIRIINISNWGVDGILDEVVKVAEVLEAW